MPADPLAVLARRLTRAALWEPETHHRLRLDRAAVERLLPHRDPFLLVDRITAADPTRGRLQAVRVIDPDDPVFAGHFPGAPVYPGVLLVEAMGQAGLCALGIQEHGGPPPPGAAARSVRVTRVHHAVFLTAVEPGDRISLTAELLDTDSLTATVATQADRDGTICAACVLEVYFV